MIPDKTTRLSLVLCCFLILFSACNKKSDSNESRDYDTESRSASDYSFAQAINDDVASISSQSEDSRLLSSVTDSTYGLFLSACAKVAVNEVSAPRVLVVDFGNTNCLCFDGKYRRGKIRVSYTGLYRDSASLHTISFDGYYVNNYKVEGSQTVVNKGHIAGGHLVYAINTNTTITDTAGNKLTFTSARTREWVAGENTKGISGWSDDVYNITGTASGITFTGIPFSASITEPLVIALNCRWVEKGTLSFASEGGFSYTIDFGGGDCDAYATVAIAGFTIPIVLP